MYLITYDNDYLKINCELKIYLYNAFKTKGYAISKSLTLKELAIWCINYTKEYKKYTNNELIDFPGAYYEMVDNLVNNDNFIKDYCCNINNLKTNYIYDNIMVFDEDLNLVGKNI